MIGLSEFNPSIIQYFSLLVLLSVIIFIRYLFAAGLYHVFVFKIFKKNQSPRILQTQEFSRKQMILEITRSAISSVIFSAIAILMLALYLKDMTLVYEEWKDYPTWYHPIGIILILVFQDTYYYWLHRWMHRPNIFRIIHKWHHDSIQTNSLTSFSFHPFETLLQSILFPILLMCVPIHLYSVILILVFMTLTAVINHGAVEIYPKMKGFRWIQKWIIGASHHDVHHRKFLFNYGLYFTFWDRLMDTEDS